MAGRAVLWDLDGTLVDSEPAHDAAFRAALQEIGLVLAPDFHARMLGVGEDAIHAELSAAGLTLDLPAWRALKWRYYSALARAVQPLAGIPAVLAGLRQAAVPMAVVSNSTRAEVDLLLAVSGLADAFATTISITDLTRGKPEPEGYLLGAARLGVRPDACVVIEDSHTGATAGVAAGMTVIFHPETPSLPDHVPPGTRYLPPGADLGECLAGLGIAAPL